jgi:2-polyprenyl-3-methyl-5-hydroxy-6-metoxy-1,4-benzoquinol methylase
MEMENEKKAENNSEMVSKNITYWESYYNSNSKRYNNSLLKQVGKTVNGNEVSKEQIELIITNINKSLCLSKNNSLIDLCCGNGLITRQLAPYVNKVLGVDMSSGLIKIAKQFNNNHNIEYINSNALDLDNNLFTEFEKVLMYEAVQHFSKYQLFDLLQKLGSLHTGSLFLLGSIPNKEKIKDYYNTEEKFMYYIRCENEGKSHMGRWWTMNEIEQIASNCGFKPTFSFQDQALYTSYYRFDVILEKL